jgi:hypothetical protein
MPAFSEDRKRAFFVTATTGYLGCALWALFSGPASITVAYIAMAAWALAAVVVVSGMSRWLALASLIFALIAAVITRLNQSPATPRGAGLPSAATAKWIQWSSTAGGNGHYFALTPWATNWTAAQDLAVSWGGHLVTITSQKEQDFINETFLTGPLDHLPVWIGLVRARANPAGPPIITGRIRRALEDLGLIRTVAHSPFEWITGEPFSYSNWKPGEPSDSPPGESWVAINWEYSDIPVRGIKGDWNDTPENGTAGYGGMTSGPYFGLVERDPMASTSSILTVNQLKLATLLWLVMSGAALVWVRKSKNQVA